MSELTITRPLDPKAVYRLLADDGSFATSLHIVLLAKYGSVIYEVDPLELILRLEEDFNVRVTDSNENKIKAILMATATDLFYDNPEAFRGTCETLTNGDPGVEVVEILTVPEVLWGVWEVELNHGPQELSPRVQAILDRVLAAEVLDPGEAAEGDIYDHVWPYLQERRQSLVDQLTELGVPPSDIPPLETPTTMVEAQDALQAQ